MLQELRIFSCVLITPKTDQAILLCCSGQGLLRVLQALVCEARELGNRLLDKSCEDVKSTKCLRSISEVHL